MLGQQIPMVAAALFISAVIWVMAKQGELATERLQIPVVLQNVPANVEIEYQPRQVPVIVRFPQTQRSRIVTQNFEVTFDVLKELGPEPRTWAGVEEPMVHTQSISLDDVRTPGLPQSVRVVEIVRQRQLELEAELATVTLPVEVQTTGELPPQFQLRAEITADPERVRVTASPETLQAAAQEEVTLKTAPVKLDGRVEDFIEYARLTVPPELELVNPSHQNVKVLVLIEEKSVQKTLPEVPVELYVLSDNLEAEIEPATVEVRLRGMLSALSQIDGSAFIFTPEEFLPEEAGLERQVELNINMREEIPAEIRQKVQIEGFAPTKVTVKFVESGDGEPADASPSEPAASDEAATTTKQPAAATPE